MKKLLLSSLIALIGTSAHAQVIHIGSVAEHTKHYDGDKPVITMYTASWCTPCQSTKPHVTKAANTYKDITFCIVDADNKATKPLLKKANVKGYPALVFSHKGRFIMRTCGGLTSGDLNKEVKKFKALLNKK